VEKQPEGYGFAVPFERVLATLATRRPDLWGSMLHVIDPEKLRDPSAILCFKAATAISVEMNGAGPESLSLVLNQLSRWNREGRVTRAAVDAVYEMAMETDLAGVPSDEAVKSQALPVLRRDLEHGAVLTSLDDYRNRRNLDRARDIIEKAGRLGTSQMVTSLSSDDAEAAFGEFDRLDALETLPTGVMPIDFALGGGLKRARYTLIEGPPRGLKTTTLCHLIAQTIFMGRNALVASLEVPREFVLARVYSNITCIPSKAIISNATGARRQMQERLEELRGADRSGLGVLRVAYFPAGTTVFKDVADWAAREEQETGLEFSAMAIDYADKMGIAGDGATWQEREKLTHQAIFDYSRASGRAMMSAVQGKDSKKQGDLDNAAGSKEKGRIADVILSILREDDGTLTFKHVKGRFDEDGQLIGPVLPDLACCQIGPVIRSHQSPPPLAPEPYEGHGDLLR
jgi:hypothetical protein